MLTLVVFIIILGLLIFVHELGHFLVAKYSGVKVEEFAFGFPPRLFSLKPGETRYSVNLIPLGGYVKMLGEEKELKNPRAFSGKSARARIAIVSAGVIMNIILAWLLIFGGFLAGMPPIATDPATLGGKQANSVLIAGIEKDSPAEKAGLVSGDILENYASTDDLREFTKSHLNQSVTLQIIHERQKTEKTIQLSANAEAPLGVAVVSLTSVKLGVWGAARAASGEIVGITRLLFRFIGDFVSTLFTHGKISENIGGPVAIYEGTGQAVRLGFIYVLQLTALLSLNLGFINILPFPALDGGRAVLIALEGIIRRKVLRQEIENYLHLAGFALLILLMVAVTFREVRGLF